MRALVLVTLVLGSLGVTIKRQSTKCTGCQCSHEEVLKFDERSQTYVAVGATLLGNEPTGTKMRTLWSTGSDVLVTPPYDGGALWTKNQTESKVKVKDRQERIQYYTSAVDATIGKDTLNMGACELETDVYRAEKGQTWADLRIAGLGPIPNNTHPYLWGKKHQRVSFCFPEVGTSEIGVVKFSASDPSPQRTSSKPPAEEEKEDDSFCARTPGCSWIADLMASIMEAISSVFCKIFNNCELEAKSETQAGASGEASTVFHVNKGVLAHHWSVKVRGMTLKYHDSRAEREVKVAEEQREKIEASEDGYWVALFDTGTSGMMLPDDVIDAVHTAVGAELTKQDSCLTEYPAKLPDLVFHLDSGEENPAALITLKPSQYLGHDCSPKKRLQGTDQSGYKGVFVIGLTAMHGKTVTFDYATSFDHRDGRKITMVDNGGAECPHNKDPDSADAPQSSETGVTEKALPSKMDPLSDGLPNEEAESDEPGAEMQGAEVNQSKGEQRREPPPPGAMEVAPLFSGTTWGRSPRV